MGRPLLKAAPVLLVISLILSISTPWLLGGRQTFSELGAFPATGLISAILLIFGAWTFNAVRIHLLSRSVGTPISLNASLKTVLAAESAGLATPAGTGGPPAFIWFLSRAGLRASQSAAVLAVDSAMDFLFFAVTLPIAALWFAQHVSQNELTVPIIIACLGGLALIGLGIASYYKRRSLAIGTGRIISRFPKLRHLNFRLGRFFIHLTQSLKRMVHMNPGQLLLAWLCCFGHWLCRYGTLAILIYFAGAAAPFSFLILAQGIILLIGQWTFLPGGGGSVEVAMAAVLSNYMEPSLIATVLILWRFISFQLYLIAGLPIVWLASRRTR